MSGGQPVANPSDGTDLLRRSLRVLETLAGMEQPVGLLALAEATCLSKASAYRALRSLQDEGYVDHVGRRGYQIGSRSIALASLIGPPPGLLQRARPVLFKLAVQAGAVATMHLRSGEHRVLAIGVQPVPNRQGGLPVNVGLRAPLTAGSSGRAILAHLPVKQAEKVIATHARAGKRAWVEHDLDVIRTLGYGVSFSENYPHFNGIGTALLDPDDGRALGSIVIAGTDRRLPEGTLRGLAAPLTAACYQLAPYVARP